MPSPLGHMIAGYIVYAAMPPSGIESQRHQGYVLAGTLLSAVAADFDFLPGMLLGTPNRFHSGPSHSLGAVVMYGLLMWTMLRCCRVVLASRLALLFASAYASHLGLDLLAVDTSSPFGIPLFWPVTSTHFISPVPLFMSIRRGDGEALTFIRSGLNAHNVLAIAWELALLSPVAFWLPRRKRLAMRGKEGGVCKTMAPNQQAERAIRAVGTSGYLRHSRWYRRDRCC